MSDERPLRTIEEWRQAIRHAYRMLAEDRIALGQELLAAKQQLGRGKFDVMLKGLPFKRREAFYYMELARKLEPFVQHVAQLPSSLRAALRLCKLDETALAAAITNGRVTPDMTAKDVLALTQARPATPVRSAWSADAAEDRLRRAVNLEVDGAGPDHVHEIILRLRRLADELERTNRPEIRDAAVDARRDIEVRDAEPGAFRNFETEQEAATHPGAPKVVASCASTYPPWYKSLTTKAPGATPLEEIPGHGPPRTIWTLGYFRRSEHCARTWPWAGRSWVVCRGDTEHMTNERLLAEFKMAGAPR